MDHESTILEQISQTKQKFYQDNTKSRIFKNTQKLQCAKQVSEQHNLQQLINLTVMVIPNTNKLYFNYLMFKTYGHPDICCKLYDHFHKLVEDLVNKYGSFEMHINLSTFTVSACVRYQKMIMLSFDENPYLTSKMTLMNVYNTPNVIEQITGLLYNSVKHLTSVTHFYKKDNSESLIKKLFEHV